MRLPKSVFIKQGKLWFRYYDPFSKRTKERSTGLDAITKNISAARQMRDEFRNEVRKLKDELDYRGYNPLSEALEEYLSVVQYRSKTEWLMRRAVGLLIEVIGDVPVQSVTAEDYNRLQYHFSWTGFSQNSKSIYSRQLYTFFQYQVKAKFLSENPITPVKSENKIPEAIPKSDLQTILDYLQGNNIEGYWIIKFMYLTGLRISEAISLTWNDIDLEEGIMYVNNIKVKRRDPRPLLSPALELLREIKAATNRKKVFLYTNTSCVFFYRAQAKLWGERDSKGRLKKKAIRKYHLHQLRKSFLSKLVEDGVSLEDAQVLAGHKDTRTTLKYYIQHNLKKIANRVNSTVKF
jgi:integrase